MSIYCGNDRFIKIDIPSDSTHDHRKIICNLGFPFILKFADTAEERNSDPEVASGTE